MTLYVTFLNLLLIIMISYPTMWQYLKIWPTVSHNDYISKSILYFSQLQYTAVLYLTNLI